MVSLLAKKRQFCRPFFFGAYIRDRNVTLTNYSYGDADGRGARSPFGELSSGIRVAIAEGRRHEGRGSVREGARAARRADEWTARRAESDSSISQVPAQSTIDRLSGRLLSA